MRKFIRTVLPHVVIVFSLMYIVFFVIDCVNSAMVFINNNMTKVLLLMLAVLAELVAYRFLDDDRLRRKKKIQRNLASKVRHS